MRHLRRLCGVLLFFFASVFCIAQAPVYTTATCGQSVCSWNAFGPQSYQTGSSQQNTFSVLNPSTTYTLHIVASSGAKATISINGTVIVKPGELAQNPVLDKPVILQTSNTVTVSGKGKKGAGTVTITVIGADSDPPAIDFTAAPTANSAGWNNSSVTVSFTCSDATSGIATCPAPITLASEAANQGRNRRIQ